MADDARIGYMPARVWGCPTTAMWVYRLGAERAKRMLLTGDTIDGAQAARLGLVLEAVPADELDAAVEQLADRMAGVPINQLVMQKLMINQAYDNMGLQGTQTARDAVRRHHPALAGGPLVRGPRPGARVPRGRPVARLRPVHPRRRRSHPHEGAARRAIAGVDAASPAALWAADLEALSATHRVKAPLPRP